MPQQAAIAVENNFKNGLITEATGLNFPENACTDTTNCVFNFNGSVSRRLGINFEDEFVVKNVNRTNVVLTSYLWKNISGAGTLSLLVVQVGGALHFYEISGATSTSQGTIADTVNLNNIASAPNANTIEAQFATGDGVLFVTHPYCRPFYCTYDAATQNVTATNLTLQIRDFEGDTADTGDVDTRPAGTRTTITKAHLYNLYNQGWRKAELDEWDTVRADMPSNVDVMWRFTDSSNNFDPGTSAVARVFAGNSAAPKGHYILDMATATNRNTLVSADDGTAITTVTETGFALYRPSTCAFYAGRIWYSGVQTAPFNNQIFFSQIIERRAQYSQCFQQNDPTSKDTFDLLASDGGVIKIPDAGTIIKLFAIPSGLAVFAERGVWFITGSTGLGFLATDYTIQKLSSITTLSATSFVDVLGAPTWWTAEGIYMLSSEQGVPSVKSITFQKIKKYYDDIPLNSKTTARGAFNFVTNVIQWIFKSEATGDLDVDYEFDRILNLNMLTGAFYPWSISLDSDVSINGILLLDGTSGSITQDEVTDDSLNNVIDDSANNVIVFSSVNSGVVPQITYVVSYPVGNSHRLTFASERSTDYVDWFSYDSIGEPYDSYFISGYKLRGQALRKWQTNWLRLYSQNEEDTQFTISGLWDYASASTTNRWSTPQTIRNDADNYAYVSKRVKMRGHGQALQFKVESVDDNPFKLVGWATLDTGNPVP